MSENGAMPQLSEHEILARDLARRILDNFPLDVCGEVTILDGRYTVRVIREAFRIFQISEPRTEPYLELGTTPDTMIVRFRKA